MPTVAWRTTPAEPGVWREDAVVVHQSLERRAVPFEQSDRSSCVPVRDHREERAFEGLARAVPSGELRDHLVDPELAPDGVDHVDRAVGPGVAEPHARLGRDRLLAREHAQDALRESLQGCAVELTIKELAGHASIETTMRYMHLASAAPREGIRALEAGVEALKAEAATSKDNA